MTARRRAREVALQLLYESDRNPHAPSGLTARFVEQRLRGPELRQFAADLVAGVASKRPELDARIEAVAQNWTLSRMSPVDRSILRLATYELLFRPDVPRKVAIDEAIELAKRFGTVESPRFVNGLLDQIVGPRVDGPEGREPGDPHHSETVERSESPAS